MKIYGKSGEIIFNDGVVYDPLQKGVFTFKTKSGANLLEILVDDDSYRYRGIHTNSLTIRYSLPEHVELPTGAYVEYEGEKYTLWLPENFKKEGARNFQYTVELGGVSEFLKKFKYKLLSSKPYELKFTLTATPKVFLELMVDVLNLNDSGWSIGKYIEAPEKVLSFNHENCYTVLGKLAQEFNTEWEIIGKTINLCKVEYNKDNPLKLSYGKGSGFKTGVSRLNDGDKMPVTILYVAGGEKNIDFSKYGSKSLLLPKSQELEYDGHRYKTDAAGMFIMRADRELTDVEEDSFDGSDIYPKRVGTVSEVIKTDEGFYDFKDSSIPVELDFSKYRISGEKATVIFQTGSLAGREFDIVQDEDSLSGYVHSERRFKLVSIEEGGFTLPNDTLCIKAGDKYAVFHIGLPDAYICNNSNKSGASWDLFKEAVRYFAQHDSFQFSFKGELDGIWAAKRWLDVGGKIRPGGYVEFSDNQFQPDGVLIRMTGVKDYPVNPHYPIIELSNSAVSGTLVDELGKIESNEVTNENRYNNALQYTQRRYQDAIEAQEMLEKAFGDYAKGIDPIWVRTMSLLAGNENLQFKFVNSRTYPSVVEPNFVYNQTTRVFTAPKSILQHMTYGIKDVKKEHSANEYKFWDLPAFTSPYLGDFGYMYLYAKCSKTGTTGEFKLTETPYKTMDPGDGYLYFMVGLLGSQYDGVRSFVTVYGFTEILPGRITVDRIVSTDGTTYFNLAIGEIGGRIKFASGSTGYENIQDKPNLGIYGTIDMLNAVKGNLQNQIDNKIETYYGTSNPWNSWPSGTEPQHVGDLWYNTYTKVLQSYVGPSSNTWATIEDAAAIAAADAASKAQDTADGKRRVFLGTPYPPYDPGDQWIEYGGKGDMRICIYGRKSGRYDATDWVLSSADGNVQASIDRGIYTGAGFLTFGGNAGLVGSGVVRIWSGGVKDNPTFKVHDTGDVYSKGTYYAVNSNGVAKAGMTGNGTAETSVRIWAGGTTPASAPFRVTQDGKATMSDGSVIGGFVIKNNTLSWQNGGATISIGYRPDVWWGRADCITAKSDSNGNAIAGIAPAGGAGIYGSKNTSPNKPADWSMWAGFFDGNIQADAFFPKGVSSIVGDATLQLDRDGAGAYEMVIKNGIVVSVRSK